MSSPAPTSNTSVKATSATTSAPRDKPELPPAPRPPSLSASFRSGLEALSAGASPQSRLVSSETPNVNATAPPSRPISSRRGMAGPNATSAPTSQYAMSNPSAPPRSEERRVGKESTSQRPPNQ